MLQAITPLLRRSTVRLHGWILVCGVLTFTPVVLLFTYPAAIAGPYLFAFIACLNVVLGAMAVLLIYGLSGGEWEHWLSVPMRAAIATLPGLALLMIPLWFSLDSIFPWADLSRDTAEFEGHQAIWLQSGLHMLRSGIYFIVWLSIAAGMSVWRFGRPLKMTPALSALSLIAFMLATSFFAIDWVMTIILEASTTMIGFLQISEQLTAALALGALWMCVRNTTRPPDSARERQRREKASNDIGNLLLAAIMFHGYCLYMDYLIVWEGNLPHEIVRYIERSKIFDGWLIGLVVVLYIGLPVLLLLFRRIKTSAKGLGAVAFMLLLGHFLLTYWYLMPVLHHPGADGAAHALLWPLLGNLALALSLVCVWVAAFVALSKRIEHQT